MTDSPEVRTAPISRVDSLSARLPVLSEHRLLRFAAFALLYVAQGLPYGLFIVAIPAWLAHQGASVGEVGAFIGFVSLPWSFKLLAAPLIDRLRLPSMGLRRPWVILAQFAITATWLLVFGVGDAATINGLSWLGFLLNACAATQDVAVDGMAIDLLPERERARANALMFGGQTLGISAASYFGSKVLIGHGMGSAALMMAGATSLILLVPLLLRERAGERLLPWSAGAASARLDAPPPHKNTWHMLRLLGAALLLPACLSILLIQFAERVGGGIASSMWANLGHDALAWGPHTYPEWASIATIVGAVLPVLLSPLIDRIGFWQTFSFVAAIKAAMYGVAAALPALWVLPAFVPGLIIGAQLLASIASVAAVSLCMSACRPAVAATQFAICMATFNLAVACGGWLVSQLDARGFGFDALFFVIAGLNVAVCLLGLVGSSGRWQKVREAQ